MIVYGACWRDDSEPWGWEPMQLYAKIEDARLHVEGCIREFIDEQITKTSNKDMLRAMEHILQWADSTYSVQEYEVK